MSSWKKWDIVIVGNTRAHEEWTQDQVERWIKGTEIFGHPGGYSVDLDVCVEPHLEGRND